MNDQQIIQKLKEVFLLYVDDESLLANASLDAHLTRDLNINSANIVDIVLDIEDMFGVEIDDDSIGEMETLRKCLAVLRSNPVLN
ncbi:MAG: phosphopantetheine-binding protein [Bacteroidota bacterium]